ncbi:MAG: MarR family transcriptional regulator [Paracoccus sp. (in: a-proteobacteria)]|nr:MarR family transcriptional regulator [Paracoccus sp. (in: a-proteobacteria)]
MTRKSTDTPESLLCFEIYAANLAFGRLLKPYLDAMGVTYPQFLVLDALWAQDGISVGDLGLRLALDSSTLSPILKRLETNRLVTRRRDSRDERRVTVTLTDLGRALQEPASHMTCKAANSTGLDAAALSDLRRSLVRLRAHLSEAAAG